MKFKKEKQNLSSFIKEFIELLEKHKAIKEEEFRDYDEGYISKDFESRKRDEEHKKKLEKEIADYKEFIEKVKAFHDKYYSQ